MLISVIMPAHNPGEFLRPAVASILRQSCQDFELIIIDDRCRDGSLATLSFEDPRLRVIDARGIGVVNAFNEGLAASHGTFIARMDADDIALPERLETQVRLLEEQPRVGICGCRVELFSDGEIGAGNAHYQAWLNRQGTPAEIDRAMYVESPMPNPGSLFRRAIIEQLGGYHDTAWPEDYDLFLRAHAAGIEMAKPDSVLLRWRDHGRRLTRTDPRYSLQSFRQAKAYYLVHGMGYRRDILIWGTGPTGVAMHDLLVAEGAQIAGFVDLHPRRIGGQKRGLPVWPLSRAADWTEGPVLIAVGARGVRPKIRRWMQEHDRREGVEYRFVA